MICEVDRFRVYFILLWVAHTKQFLPKRLPLVTGQKEANMSDENLDERTRFLLKSHTAKELERHLQQLRQFRLLQRKEKTEELTDKVLSRRDPELPLVQSSSDYGSHHVVTCLPAKGSNIQFNESRLTSFAESNCYSLCIRGKNFEGMKPKQQFLSAPKSNFVARRQRSRYSESLDDRPLVVCPAPSFRSWSRGQKEKESRRKQREFKMQEVNDERFYSKHQQPRADCLNLKEILHQVQEINNFNEDHTEGKLVALMPSHNILMAGVTRAKELTVQESLSNKQEKKAWTVPKLATPVRKEQRLKKLLRGQLMSCYNLGPVLKPSGIAREAMSRRNQQNKEKLKLDFPPMKQEVFPYSVPHLRLPLLPSSRNELVQISNVLAKCEIIPWQLQSIKIKYTKRA